MTLVDEEGLKGSGAATVVNFCAVSALPLHRLSTRQLYLFTLLADHCDCCCMIYEAGSRRR